MIDLVFDSLRVAHMGFFAIGIGTALFLEVHLLKRFRDCIDLEGLRIMLSGHDLVRAAVIGLWVTGSGLMFMRLAVLGDPFSAKLGVKLAVVAALTMNIVAIERFLIPEVFIHEGSRFKEIPFRTRMQLGSIAGFSAGAWFSSLLLGGIGSFKAMGLADIMTIVVPLIALATLVGSIVAISSGVRSGVNYGKESCSCGSRSDALSRPLAIRPAH